MSNLLLLAEPSVPNDRFIFFEFSKVANGMPEPSLRLETGQLTILALFLVRVLMSSGFK